MLNPVSLRDQVKSVQSTYAQYLDAETNMQAGHFMYALTYMLDLHETHPDEITEAADAITYVSLKRAFMRGVEHAANDRMNRDSETAIALRPFIETFNQSLKPRF